jgi:hypothetical protein
MNMARWTREEEAKLLRMYEMGLEHEKMAEALDGRSIDAIKGKLRRLREKRPETTLPIYRGEGGACTEEQPEAEQIYDELILALLDEFRKIRETLPNLGKKHIKHKPGFYNNLCRMAETLISLLETKPEKASIEEWFEEIALTKLPEEARREPRRVIQKWMRGSKRLSRIR